MEEHTAPEAQSSTTAPTKLLESLLANPELLRNIGGMLGANAEPQKTTPSAPNMQEDDNREKALFDSDAISKVLASPELMAKLPAMMEMLKPMLSASSNSETKSSQTPPPPSPKGKELCRDELLLALKPFLSPERCEAVDSIIRISKLGNVLKQLK